MVIKRKEGTRIFLKSSHTIILKNLMYLQLLYTEEFHTKLTKLIHKVVDKYFKLSIQIKILFFLYPDF